MPALALLTGPSVPPAGRDALVAALTPVAAVVMPEVRPDLSAADVWTASVDAVRAALPGPGLVCGIGAGALLALHVAARDPARVAGLVLCTAVPAGAVPVRPVHAAVAALLPVPALRRLGSADLLLRVVDPVRPQDVRPLAPQVRAPAVIPYGQRDPVNRSASLRLARALPAGRPVELPGARPGWVWREPERLATVVASVAGAG